MNAIHFTILSVAALLGAAAVAHKTGYLHYLLTERPVTNWLIRTRASASAWPLAKEVGEFADWTKRVITNFPAVAVLMLDLYAYATPDMHAFIQSNPTLLALICVLNIVVRLAKPKDSQTQNPQAHA